LFHFFISSSGRAKLAAEPARHRTLFPELFVKPKKGLFEKEEMTIEAATREDSSLSEMA
jgi:hypothetical protein